MRRRSPALLLLAILLMAGCVGREEAPAPLEQAASAVLGPSPEELARTPGSIAGLVTSDNLQPVAGALVTLVREERSTTTDAAGLFRLEGLATGEHLLQVSAEGHAPRSVTALARNGTVTDLNVTLQRVAPPEPFAQTHEFGGLLACGLRVEAPVGTQERDCASADPNHRDVFEFPLLEDGREVVLELAWDAETNPGARRLRLSAETVGYGAEDLDLGNVTGEGYARLAVPLAVMEKFYPEGGLMRARVALAADGEAPVGAALQQTFTLYVTAFYHGSAPAGYSVLGAPQA